jgi:hypothetical protein
VDGPPSQPTITWTTLPATTRLGAAADIVRAQVLDSLAAAEEGDQCTGLKLLPLLCAACVLSITKCLLLVAVPELPERKGRVLARTAGLEQGS